MTKLLLSYNDKGGVKKSFLLVHLVMYLMRHGLNLHPVDLDTKIGTTSRVFPSPTGSRVSPEPLLQHVKKSDLIALMQSLLDGVDLAIDCGANTTPGWITLFGDTWPKLRQLLTDADVQTTLVVPVTTDPDTYRSIGMAQEIFPRATIILALAPNRGDVWPTPPAGFPPTHIIRVDPAPAKLINAYLSLSKPLDTLATMTFEQPEMKAIPGMARTYLRSLHAQFDSIRHLILQPAKAS